MCYCFIKLWGELGMLSVQFWTHLLKLWFQLLPTKINYVFLGLNWNYYRGSNHSCRTWQQEIPMTIQSLNHISYLFICLHCFICLYCTQILSLSPLLSTCFFFTFYYFSGQNLVFNRILHPICYKTKKCNKWYLVVPRVL